MISRGDRLHGVSPGSAVSMCGHCCAALGLQAGPGSTSRKEGMRPRCLRTRAALPLRIRAGSGKRILSRPGKHASRFLATVGRMAITRPASARASNVALMGRRREDGGIAAREEQRAAQIFLHHGSEHHAEKERRRLAVEAAEDIAEEAEQGHQVDVHGGVGQAVDPDGAQNENGPDRGNDTAPGSSSPRCRSAAG